MEAFKPGTAPPESYIPVDVEPQGEAAPEVSRSVPPGSVGWVVLKVSGQRRMASAKGWWRHNLAPIFINRALPAPTITIHY